MGKLTIDTGFDLSGAEKGYKRLTDSAKETARKTAESFDGATIAIMKQQAVIDGLKSKLEAISEYESETAIAEQLKTDLAAAEVEAMRFDKQIEELSAKLSYLTPKGKAKVNEQIAEMVSKTAEAADKTEILRAKLAELQIPEKPKETIEQLNDKLNIASFKLLEMQTKSDEIGTKTPKAIQAAEKATNSFGASISKTAKRIKQLLISVMVFNVLRSAFKGLRDYIGLALKDNQKFVNSWAQVKGNLQTAFQPILEFVIPVLAKLINWLALATQYLVKFVSALTGKSIKSMQDAAKNMNQLAENTKKAGKEAKKTTASFDEINQVIQNTSEASEPADPGITPQYGEVDELTGKMQDTIAAIAIMVGGALLILGAICNMFVLQ